MALDPITALSVTAAVVQFVDFSRNIVSKSKELYRSTAGVPRENLETETVAMRLREITDQLHGATAHAVQSTVATPSSLRIEQICIECVRVSAELLHKPHQLKVPADAFKFKPWKSFRQALKSVWSRAAVDAMASRLAGASGRMGRGV